MGYTWQDVMFGIDVQKEGMEERKQQQDILDEQADEAEMMGYAKLGSTLLCGALFGLGPIGAFMCSQLSRTAVDMAYDWEGMEVDAGKFYKSEAEEFKKTRDEAAEDQKKGQVIDTMIDLGTMYVQAGGLVEGMDADFTTYGAGEGEWSLFGKKPTPVIGEEYLAPADHLIDGISVAEGTQLTPVTFEGREVHSLLSEGLPKAATGPIAGADWLKTLAAEYYSKNP